jgi:hypothetical protein
LRGVFDHRQAMLASDGIDSIHVADLPVQRDWHDRLGARRDGGFEQTRVEVVGARVDVHEHRLRAGKRDHLAGRNEGERRRDHFVAAADAVRHQGDQQRVGAARRADAMLDADVLGELALQLLVFRAENELPMIQHRLHAPVHGFADTLVLSLEIDEIHAARMIPQT